MSEWIQLFFICLNTFYNNHLSKDKERSDPITHYHAPTLIDNRGHLHYINNTILLSIIVVLTVSWNKNTFIW